MGRIVARNSLRILAVIVVSPFVYRHPHTRARGLHEVRAGVLYRSGQFESWLD